MQNDHGFDFWAPNRKTCDVYLRTDRKDWFAALDKIVEEIGAGKRMIDIGSGDGHTTRQILAQLPCHDYECHLLEPDKDVLKRSLAFGSRRFGMPLEKFLERHEPVLIEITKQEHDRQADHGVIITVESRPIYDIALAIHSNYYWGYKDGKYARDRYAFCIDGLVAISRKVIIMTAPGDSDYYKVVDKNPFSDDVFAEWLVAYAKGNGYETKVIPCGMRFYTYDCLKDDFAAVETWRFFNNTQGDPTVDEMSRFRSRLKDLQHDGCIDFRDVLVVLQNKKLQESNCS